jgi:hypothetical protein
MSRPEFDQIDAAIVAEAQKLRAAEDLNRSYPREGDALVFSCGTVRHVSNAYEDSAQPTVGYDASFYLSKHGHMSFSGTLGASIPNKHFTRGPSTTGMPARTMGFAARSWFAPGRSMHRGPRAA